MIFQNEASVRASCVQVLGVYFSLAIKPLCYHLSSSCYSCTSRLCFSVIFKSCSYLQASQPVKHDATADKEILATPVVRKLAREHNVLKTSIAHKIVHLS